MKFSNKDFLSKCYQIHSFLWIRSYLLKKSVKEYIAMGVHFRSLQEAILPNNFF